MLSIRSSSLATFNWRSLYPQQYKTLQAYPIPKALVQELSPDWKTVLRTSSTDAKGRFSLASARGRKIYFLQISAPGFDPLRVRIQVEPRARNQPQIKANNSYLARWPFHYFY
jgi:hypothetical protein